MKKQAYNHETVKIQIITSIEVFLIFQQELAYKIGVNAAQVTILLLGAFFSWALFPSLPIQLLYPSSTALKLLTIFQYLFT